MRLDKLTMKGVLAFQREISIDFKELPPGLIALVGPNGSGKTTIMESPAATLFRQYPSRDKPIVDYATGTDAFLETTFELEGRGLFRARLNLDQPHRKTEATIARIESDGRAVLLNDGLLTTYDAAVAELLPPLPDLLASVMSVQTKVGSFSTLDRKGRRVLFGSLLGLDHIEALAERARLAVTRVTATIDKESAARDALARITSVEEESAFGQRAQQLQTESGAVESRRTEVRRLITEAETALSSLQEAAATHAAAREAHDRHEAARLANTAARDEQLGLIDRAQRTLASETTRLAKALATWLDRNQAEQLDDSAHAAELARAATARDATVAEATKRIEANQGLLARAAEIRGAAAAVETADASLAATGAAAAALRADLTTLEQRDRVLRDALVVIAQRQAELDRAERDAAKLKEAPFGERCAPCGFMTDAVTATSKIAGLREAVQSKATAEQELATVQALATDVRTALAGLAEEAVRLTDDRKAKKGRADELPHLTAAEEKIATRKQQIADAHARHAQDVAAADARRKERVVRLERDAEHRKAEHQGELVVLEERATKEIAEARAKAEALAEVITRALFERDAAADVVAATKDAARDQVAASIRLATYREEWNVTTGTLATVTSQIEAHARRVEEYRARRQELDATERRIDALRTELVEWNALAKTFGRDGLQTLEIDNAGPAVSSFTNDLLQHCFGGRFSVDLITQAPKLSKGKDGSTHKEVFELIVYDNQRGGAAMDLTDLSGGQRVIVEEALKSAIALLVNTRNQHPIRTAWRDETTGALYPEVLPDYVAMLRRVQEVGGFWQILFVTHNADCARLADAQIHVEAGDRQILLPPFADAPVARELVEA